MHKQSEADWAPLPTLSAFTEAEVAEVEQWVRSGGALFLIADHMPLAGHAEALAAAFGIRFQNGFAQDAKGNGQLTFRRSDGSLPPASSPTGAAAERVDSVAFTARLRDPARTAACCGWRPRSRSSSPTRRPDSGGQLLQGAIVYHGQGRVAVFGEAAMFTAQVPGPTGARWE